MKNILIAYASRAGSTQGVAEAIGAELVKYDANVTMRYLLDVNSVSDYDVVVLGSAIRHNHWLPEAIKFVQIHQKSLKTKQTAYFVVCMTLHQNTPENRITILNTLNPVCEMVKPIDIGLFAGALHSNKLKHWWSRFLVKFMQVPEGDFRDFALIKSWAQDLAATLALSKSSKYAEK